MPVGWNNMLAATALVSRAIVLLWWFEVITTIIAAMMDGEGFVVLQEERMR